MSHASLGKADLLDVVMDKVARSLSPSAHPSWGVLDINAFAEKPLRQVGEDA